MPEVYRVRRVQECARFYYQFSLSGMVDRAGDMAYRDFAARRVKNHGAGVYGNKPHFCAGLSRGPCAVTDVRDVVCPDAPRV